MSGGQVERGQVWQIRETGTRFRVEAVTQGVAYCRAIVGPPFKTGKAWCSRTWRIVHQWARYRLLVDVLPRSSPSREAA